MACDHNLIGSLKVGVTDFNILNAHVNCNIPSHIEGLPMNTYYIDGEFNKSHRFVTYPSFRLNINFLKIATHRIVCIG